MVDGGTLAVVRHFLFHPQPLEVVHVSRMVAHFIGEAISPVRKLQFVLEPPVHVRIVALKSASPTFTLSGKVLKSALAWRENR